MENVKQKFGFIYFREPKYFIQKKIINWMPILKRLGASYVIFDAGYDHSISEDVFISTIENKIDPIVHFSSELPITRKFNDVKVIMDAYAKWGVGSIIFSDKPNTKNAWLKAGWQYEKLVDRFLDRFIPLANHAVRIGIRPVLPPMQPGGNYWDTAFIELVLKGLKRRKLDTILESLILSSYGYNFNKPLSWGKGGPERWSASKPYLTPDGQEDQLGFQNFEWIQAYAKRQIGEELPVMILDAGNLGSNSIENQDDTTIETIQIIHQTLIDEYSCSDDNLNNKPEFNDSVFGCFFDLDTLKSKIDAPLTYDLLERIFNSQKKGIIPADSKAENSKVITNYLLLPLYKSGVSDAVLSRVRPIIKKYLPTIGFSIAEAKMAKKVMVYPDPTIFTDEQINQLRAEGCSVEILPDSGIKIATLLQE